MNDVITLFGAGGVSPVIEQGKRLDGDGSVPGIFRQLRNQAEGRTDILKRPAGNAVADVLEKSGGLSCLKAFQDAVFDVAIGCIYPGGEVAPGGHRRHGNRDAELVRTGHAEFSLRVPLQVKYERPPVRVAAAPRVPV